MSQPAQWSPSPVAVAAAASAVVSPGVRDREHYNECLARFKPCHEIRASSPSPAATTFTTASPTPAPSLVKESRPGPPSPSPTSTTTTSSFPCSWVPPGSAVLAPVKIAPFRASSASGHIPTANVPPFFQDVSKAAPVTTSRASPLIQGSSAPPTIPLKSARPFLQTSPPAAKGPATLQVPPFVQGRSPRASPDKGSPPFVPNHHHLQEIPAPQAPAVLVPFYQEASSTSSSSRGSASQTPRSLTPPEKAASSPFERVSPTTDTLRSVPQTPTTATTTTPTKTCRGAWLGLGPRTTSTTTTTPPPLAATTVPPITEEEEDEEPAVTLSTTTTNTNTNSNIPTTKREDNRASPPPPGLWFRGGEVGEVEQDREEEEEEESWEEEPEPEPTPGCLRSLLSTTTTGRSQSKGGYSRMWEDPVGERHAIPLYNRLHFSTLPARKSAANSAAAVTKKTWYLVHNTYASLQNSNNGHHHHHQHPHHHSPHHAPHPFPKGAGRMEEVGAGDEFRSHNHAERLMRKMETCASKRQLCDVVLIAGQRRLPAHRLVLSAASDYFAAMFMSNVREANMEEVEIKDVDPDALAALVHYTYTGRIELKEETVECLLSTACLLQLSEVVEACCSFLMKQLHPSNCIGIRQFADAQGCTDLYKVANNYVMEMFVEVMHNSEFLMLPWEEVGRLLASDDLNVPNEETIFEALVHWAKHDLAARRKNLSKLLAHIKLPLMAPQYIADHVETNSLFREDRECQQLIMEALKYHLLPERRSSFQSPRTKPRKSTVGLLYAVGGMDCTKGATSIEKYELRTNTWTQVANMSGRRLQFGVAVLEDRLYVVGGRDGLKTLNTVECYDPKKKTWTLMPPMSTHRHGLGVGVLEGPMYAVGGHDGWSYLNTVERWDPQARQWSYVAPMSTARSTVGVASLHAKLYAVGGRDGSSCLKSVECFDPHTNKWTHCTPMSKRRGGVGVATCNGFLYAVGGHEAPATNPTCSRYDSAERYDPKTDQWTNISPISSPRDAVGLCPLGDKLFAVGGYDGQQYLNDVECYDPVTNEWIKVASLCTGRAGACVVHVPNS